MAKIISANENILFVLNDNKVLATPKAVQITIVVDGESKPYTYNYGDTLNFDFDIPSTKYVSKITDSANNKYTFGDNYVIEKTETLLVQLADKIKVKLIYEDEEKIELLTPYAEFVLPSKKIVPIISIISACFAGVLLVASLIAYFYFRNKNSD